MMNLISSVSNGLVYTHSHIGYLICYKQRKQRKQRKTQIKLRKLEDLNLYVHI